MTHPRSLLLPLLVVVGLLGAVAASAKSEPAAQAAAANAVATAGLDVGPRLKANHPSLPAGLGVLVTGVDPKGPAAGQVEEGDILTRLDEQKLFRADQFQDLVRSLKPGTRVKLTLLRGAEPLEVEVVLGSRVAGREEAMAPSRRSIEVSPGITILPHPGASSARSFSFSFGSGTKTSSSSVATDGEGTVSLKESDGKKQALVKDREGKVLFEGDVTDPAVVEKLPPEIRRRLQLVDGKRFARPSPPAGAKPAAKPAAEEPKKKFDPKQGA